MSVRFTKQYFSFNRILESHEDKANPTRSYTKVIMSSNWKGRDEKRHYSDWIAKFKGNAFMNVATLKKGDFIMCSGSFTREAFEKEGKRMYPEATMNIFEWEKWVAPESVQVGEDAQIEDEFPF